MARLSREGHSVRPIPWPNTKWSGAPSLDESRAKSIGFQLAAILGRPTIVDFVAVRATKIHKLHQVLSRNLLILREENRVGNLVPNRVPHPIEIC